MGVGGVGSWVWCVGGGAEGPSVTGGVVTGEGRECDGCASVAGCYVSGGCFEFFVGDAGFVADVYEGGGYGVGGEVMVAGGMEGKYLGECCSCGAG